ncbi:hypothetical protein ABIF52_007346 [Bradyrhizobium japonicum]
MRRSTSARRAPTASSPGPSASRSRRFSPEGKTIGHHYAGPSWELADSSAVVGKAIGNAPGATGADIPWLKLEVASRRGSGVLTPVTTVQRINTHGGKLEGSCDKAGEFKSAPYSADYVFLKKG